MVYYYSVSACDVMVAYYVTVTICLIFGSGIISYYATLIESASDINGTILATGVPGGDIEVIGTGINCVGIYFTEQAFI